MSVRLIALTKPAIPECSTAGDLIAYCARVSNPANQGNIETAPRLLRRMVRKRHWSPFEMAHMVVEIVTTRDIARQILRHRSFSFQEFSQRYAAVVAPPIVSEARLQHPTDRQASLHTNDEALQEWWRRRQGDVADLTGFIYQEALAKGVAKEVARKVLPEGLTESVLYMAGSVRSWIHYVQLRTDESTQLEHRLIAHECESILINRFPELAEVLVPQREPLPVKTAPETT